MSAASGHFVVHALTWNPQRLNSTSSWAPDQHLPEPTTSKTLKVTNIGWLKVGGHVNGEEHELRQRVTAGPCPLSADHSFVISVSSVGPAGKITRK